MLTNHALGATPARSRRTLNAPSNEDEITTMCKKEYEAGPRVGIMGEAPVLVAASAPGKCILFGEHAVVYGQPAVAVAIEQRLSISRPLRPHGASTEAPSTLNGTRTSRCSRTGGFRTVSPWRSTFPATSASLGARLKRCPQRCGWCRHAPSCQRLKGIDRDGLSAIAHRAEAHAQQGRALSHGRFDQRGGRCGRALRPC